MENGEWKNREIGNLTASERPVSVRLGQEIGKWKMVNGKIGK